MPAVITVQTRGLAARTSGLGNCVCIKDRAIAATPNVAASAMITGTAPTTTNTPAPITGAIRFMLCLHVDRTALADGSRSLPNSGFIIADVPAPSSALDAP